MSVRDVVRDCVRGVVNPVDARLGLPYPTAGLDVIVYNETYEDGGTTYYKTSTGVGLDVIGQDTDGEDIINFAPLNDARFDKGSYVGNAYGLPEYYDSPYVNIYFDETSAATRYHWKLTDFHYRWLEKQSVGLTNWAFGRLNFADEAYVSADRILIYSAEQTVLTKLYSYCHIEDFQNQSNYYYTGEWIIRDMLQFVVEGGSFSLDLDGTGQKVYWGDGTDSYVNANATYSRTFDNIDKHLISVTTGLTRFDINNKSLTGDIAYWSTQLVKMTNLQIFYIHENQFTGDLSGWNISGLTNLQRFYIHSNQFTGDLSSWDISGLTNLEYFLIYINQFEGDLSGWDISGLTNLQLFYIFSNQFTGDLSGWNISGLTNLQRFYIYSNQFTGDLSIWDISGLINLEQFQLHENAFEGDLSTWNISTLTKMQYFRIYDNLFTGDLSGWDISGWTDLIWFYIHSNQFTGDLSGWNISGLTNLQRFYIHSNQFTGAPYTQTTSIIEYLVDGNQIPTSGIDAILAGLETFFSTNTPIKNATFNLENNGVPEGSAVPTAAGLADKTAIEGYYTDAGFTATITVDT